MKRLKHSLLALTAFLFALTAAALTSCSCDEDDTVPEVHVEGVSQITIGGENGMTFYNTINRSYHKISQAAIYDDAAHLHIVLYNGTITEDYGDASINLVVSCDNFKTGQDVTNKMKAFGLSLPFGSGKHTHYVNGEDLIVKSGKAVISSVTSKYVTVHFSSYVVNLDGIAYRIDGSATCEMQDED